MDPGDETVTLPRDEAQHLTKVLRLGVGDTVAVFDGRGHEFLARVASAAGRDVRVQLLSRIEACRAAGRWVLEDVFTAGEVVWSLVHGHMSIELAGYFVGLQRDPEATYEECLRRVDLGFGDDPEQSARSLEAGGQRARQRRPQN